MIKYRPHRGSLADAMKEYHEFETIDEMKQYIVSQHNGMISINDIVITEDYGEDKRIGWKESRHICIKKFGNEDYIALYGTPQCIAWCDLGKD